MDELLVGWKEIGWEWGLRGVSFQTIRRWARMLHMPVIYIKNKPAIEKSKLHLWWEITLKKSPKEFPLFLKEQQLNTPK